MNTRGQLIFFGSTLGLGLFFGIVFHFLLMPLLSGITYCIVSVVILQLINYTILRRLYRRILWGQVHRGAVSFSYRGKSFMKKPL